jgi:hypothetical protein
VSVSDADHDGVWVASDNTTSVYGNGDTPDEAVNDYLACLTEQFDWMQRHESELAPTLARELEALRRLMISTNHE